ncbi:ABC transporter permease [bacterium]|nr:ABC transporter permease [bacterium]
MGFFRLVFANLFRNKIRTTLTMLSVAVAAFLFCALEGVLDTLEDAIKLGSETRLVTRNEISLVFPLPLSYKERIGSVAGVEDVTTQNWFGGQDPKDSRNFFAQFAVEENTYPMYKNEMEIIDAIEPQAARGVPDGMDARLAAYLEDRTAAIVGKSLFDRMGWKLGDTITINGTIYPGEWPFKIAAVYRAKKRSFGEETLFFHWDYLYEKSGREALAGIYVLKLADPDKAGDVSRAVDAMFENSTAQTKTETESAFQAGFVSMYGNIPFVLRVIGFAVVFAILLVAANTMVMAVRERTGEIGVYKTLGFTDGAIFRLVLAEAALITLTAGLCGTIASKLLIEKSGFNAGGMLPPMSVHWATVAAGVGVTLVVGAVSGMVPAWQAARLKIVDAMRRVG